MAKNVFWVTLTLTLTRLSPKSIGFQHLLISTYVWNMESICWKLRPVESWQTNRQTNRLTNILSKTNVFESNESTQRVTLSKTRFYIYYYFLLFQIDIFMLVRHRW